MAYTFITPGGQRKKVYGDLLASTMMDTHQLAGVPNAEGDALIRSNMEMAGIAPRTDPRDPFRPPPSSSMVNMPIQGMIGAGRFETKDQEIARLEAQQLNQLALEQQAQQATAYRNTTSPGYSFSNGELMIGGQMVPGRFNEDQARKYYGSVMAARAGIGRQADPADRIKMATGPMNPDFRRLNPQNQEAAYAQMTGRSMQQEMADDRFLQGISGVMPRQQAAGQIAALRDALQAYQKKPSAETLAGLARFGGGMAQYAQQQAANIGGIESLMKGDAASNRRLSAEMKNLETLSGVKFDELLRADPETGKIEIMDNNGMSRSMVINPQFIQMAHQLRRGLAGAVSPFQTPSSATPQQAPASPVSNDLMFMGRAPSEEGRLVYNAVAGAGNAVANIPGMIWNYTAGLIPGVPLQERYATPIPFDMPPSAPPQSPTGMLRAPWR